MGCVTRRWSWRSATLVNARRSNLDGKHCGLAPIRTVVLVSALDFDMRTCDKGSSIVEKFLCSEMNIDGKKLPLFALQRGKLLESVLHITDARHREQIATRITLDVVFSSRTGTSTDELCVILTTCV